MTPPIPTAARRCAATAAAALLAAATACSATAAPAPDGSAAAGTGYRPVTVADCTGTETRYERAPSRVVPLSPSVLEMVLWLGAEDRIAAVGQQPRPGAMPPEFADTAAGLASLSGSYTVGGGYRAVPREELLSVQPDLVLGGFPSNFDAEGAMSQQELAEAGADSYLAFSTSCATALTGPQTDLELVYRDLENLGGILGVPERAAELVEEMRARVSQAGGRAAAAERPTVFPFEFDEGTATPYAPGNRQTVNAVIELAGGRNLFADRDGVYEQVGWEQVVDRDPDVILVIVYDQGGAAANAARAAEAEEFLTSAAALRGVTAVRERRFARLVYEEASVGGVRTADAVAELAEQLHGAP